MGSPTGGGRARPLCLRSRASKRERERERGRERERERRRVARYSFWLCGRRGESETARKRPAGLMPGRLSTPPSLGEEERAKLYMLRRLFFLASPRGTIPCHTLSRSYESWRARNEPGVCASFHRRRPLQSPSACREESNQRLQYVTILSFLLIPLQGATARIASETEPR